jgi:hypothetical protein
MQKLIERDMNAPQTYFLDEFGQDEYPSDTIEWESYQGDLGLTPFVPPGTVAPTLAPTGVGEHSAKAAFWKEKMYMDEEWLNNIRQMGTREKVEPAERKLARELTKMRNRCVRRREWMYAKMFTEGQVNYLTQSAVHFTVSYGIPSEHIVNLTSDERWINGSSPDIVGDVFDAKEALSDAVNAEITHMIFNNKTLRTMVEDSTIQNLLKKSAFGQGDLFARPIPVIGSLLDIPNLVNYNEKYKIRAMITNINSTTITLDEITSDVEADMSVRFVNQKTGKYEDKTVSSVDVSSAQIVINEALSNSYVEGRDHIEVTASFIPDNKVVFLVNRIDGMPIAEFMQAPFGLDRHYGQKVDRKEEWDPEGLWVRVQDKGLPVLYHRDAVYILNHD